MKAAIEQALWEYGVKSLGLSSSDAALYVEEVLGVLGGEVTT